MIIKQEKWCKVTLQISYSNIWLGFDQMWSNATVYFVHHFDCLWISLSNINQASEGKQACLHRLLASTQRFYCFIIQRGDSRILTPCSYKEASDNCESVTPLLHVKISVLDLVFYFLHTFPAPTSINNGTDKFRGVRLWFFMKSGTGSGVELVSNLIACFKLCCYW